MSATKRKFGALIQGLGDPRRTSDGSDISNQSLLQKRRRLGFPPSTAPNFEVPTSPAAGLAATYRSKRDRDSTRDHLQKPAVKYCPTDRGELLKRLETFQDITRWTPKPDKINEVHWARRGWICQSKETVRCVLCNKELIVRLSTNTQKSLDRDEKTAASTQVALVAKYVELMSSSHQDDCLWRRKGCDDHLLRLSMAGGGTARISLRQRYDELIARDALLPFEFNLRLPDGLDMQRILHLFTVDCPEKKSSASLPSDVPSPVGNNTVALALAICGWQGLVDARIGPVLTSISCRTCLRRLGLWLFKSKEVDDNGNITKPAPMEYLDPVREHRFFCPWRNPESQSMNTESLDTELLPAWKLLVRTLENDMCLRNAYDSSSGASCPAETSHDGNSGQEPEAQVQDDDARDKRDKERWVRLKKIKSLFDLKGSRHSRSRPGTSHSVQISDK